MSKYIYKVSEQSVDVREYEIESNAKLTYEEVISIYQESEEHKYKEGLERYVDWSDERFTDDQIINEIKIKGIYDGTKYGEDCQIYIYGDLEE